MPQDLLLQLTHLTHLTTLSPAILLAAGAALVLLIVGVTLLLPPRYERKCCLSPISGCKPSGVARQRR
jgi:hypothetical protein